MSVSKDPTMAPAGVSFEVDRFAWADGRLEVTGRWYGIRGRRFLRPTLDVEVDGRARRMLAVLEHKPWAADDGEEWVAAFDWDGEPVDVAVAELAVAPELAVVLPPPSGAPAKKPKRTRPAAERLEARPPRAQALEAQLAEAEAEIATLRDRLAAEQGAWRKRVEEIETLRDESAAATSAAEAERDEMAAARDEAAAARDAVAKERDAAIAERDELVSARDAAIAERAAAVAARNEALVAAEAAKAERDKAIREKTAVEHELAAAERARDKARQERNEWLTRARDAMAAGKGPQAEGEAAPAKPRRPLRAQRTPPDDAEPDAEAATVPLPRPEGPAPAPGGGPTGKPRKAQIPPGGILLPPTGPGSHMRRSLLPGWAPQVLAPVLLVLLVVVIAVLIVWAF
ncbi:MAG TPA: hypothetical protein VG126_05500 [Thermoleophilaceae bacterium]|nr:hypothetical protein [Thermoleophilaceae bacterium]